MKRGTKMSTKTIEFLTAYGPKPKTKANKPGTEEETTYSERRNEQGHPYLVKTGVKNTYQERQELKGEYDIYSMLERYANGDMGVMRNGAQYIDATAMPSNFHEAYNIMTAQREKFNALPVELKQKFSNDWVQWASQSGTAEWLEKMGLNQKEPVKEEVNDNGES